MIGRADIEGSKSNVAMNAWLPQAVIPVVTFLDTSSFKFRSSTGSSFPADSAKPVPLLWFRWSSRQGQVGISSESTVRRPGKATEATVPNPSPDRHAATRSRRGSSSSSPPAANGFGTGTPVPSPQSQSFSRGYGSILPTSLAYIVPSTRGCSPWRPDAVMSTTGRDWYSVLRIFKGRRGRTGHHATCGALPAAGPYLRLSRFQGGQAICTNGGSTRARALGFAATAAPSYSSGPNNCPDGRLGTVTRLPVHPASPVLLTKNGPLGALDSVARLNETGRMGSPLADAGSTQLPRHAVRRVLPTTIAERHLRRRNNRPRLGSPPQSASVRAPSRVADQLSPFRIRPTRIAGPHPLPSRQFQALFDSLFKVLFIFPSRYLFAIGLSPVFSLGRNLPPDWGCIPKQPDSPTAPRGATGSGHDGALTLSGATFQGTWARSVAEDASTDYNSDDEAVRFPSWAFPGSLAVTRGILVVSFPPLIDMLKLSG
ncbi:hypothetical protein ACHQM5_030976 [Ranunculus cassubicifolius]